MSSSKSRIYEHRINYSNHKNDDKIRLDYMENSKTVKQKCEHEPIMNTIPLNFGIKNPIRFYVPLGSINQKNIPQ